MHPRPEPRGLLGVLLKVAATAATPAPSPPDPIGPGVRSMPAETLMSAQADGLCGAGYERRTSERTNRRNGSLMSGRWRSE